MAIHSLFAFLYVSATPSSCSPLKSQPGTLMSYDCWCLASLDLSVLSIHAVFFSPLSFNAALKLPLGKTTVMHLVARETLPEPNSQGNHLSLSPSSPVLCLLFHTPPARCLITQFFFFTFYNYTVSEYKKPSTYSLANQILFCNRVTLHCV